VKSVLKLIIALTIVNVLIGVLSSIESDIVETQSAEKNETTIEYAIYYYPVLTEIEQHMLVWKRYEQIET